jgi:predicted DNA binding CopG/RHH family protein
LYSLEKLDVNDRESKKFYNDQLDQVRKNLEFISRPSERKNFRVSVRLTYDEAKAVRWNAARLSLNVAEYLRFVLFDYYPFTKDDQHLCVDSRKRFYLSILDVTVSGWGQPPAIHNCPNCARYHKENEALRKKLAQVQ